MATILTKKSDTNSSVPLAADLTNAAGGAELAVNTADKRLYSKTSGGSVVELGTNPSALSLPNGTANGVPYLNGSKVLTSGSALTFDGTNLGVGGVITSGYKLSVNGDIWQGNGAGAVIGTIANNAGWYDFGGSSNVNGVQMSHQTAARWLINSSEGMRLTSTGLGIGTSSPSDKLTVVSTAQYSGATIQGGATNGASILTLKNSDSAGSWGLGVYGSGIAGTANNLYVYDNIAGAVRLVMNTSGNLGLGVTPSAWDSVFKSFDGGGSGCFGSLFFQANGDYTTALGSNLYYNGGWKYKATAAAGKYELKNNTHAWYTAPSGTAGNAISFTQAMTLDASGNLLVGTTSSNGGTIETVSRSGVWGLIVRDAANNQAGIQFRNASNTAVGSVAINSTTTSYNTSSDYRLKENIAPMTGALAKVAALKPVTYTWKADGSAGEGFIAHELAEVCPAAVTGEKDAVDKDGKPQYQGIDVSFLVGTLTAAIQELKAEFDAYKATHP